LGADDAQAERLIELVDAHLFDVVTRYGYEPHVLRRSASLLGGGVVIGEVVSLTHGRDSRITRVLDTGAASQYSHERVRRDFDENSAKNLDSERGKLRLAAIG
jgi:hypothetical protein